MGGRRRMGQSLQNISKQNRLKQWSRKIVACRSSGMTVRTWCQKNGISEKTYYYWQRRLFQELANVHPQNNGFVEVTPSRVESSGQIAVKSTLRVLRWTFTAARIPQHRRLCSGYCGMLNDFAGADRVYIACGYTDLRLGIDGLAALVKRQFALDPVENCLFLFCGRRRDRIKALYWEGNGFLLLYKRLESGVFQWPRKESEARALTTQQYR